MIYVVYISNFGVPETGLSPTIDIYKKVSDGSDVASPPVISELGGGFYKFTASPSEALAVRVDVGATLADPDRYKVLQITPNDDDLDAAVSTRSTATQGATAAELTSAVSPLALEANVQGHTAAALSAYDPPTKAELDAAQAAIEAAMPDVSGLPTLAEIEASTILAKQADVLRALGLMQENFYLDNPTYNDSGLLTGCRLRIYSDAGSVGTDNDVLATYQVTSTYQGVRRQTYQVVKQ